MKYTLRQLQVFLAAAQHENISRAAESLSMSQSAASSSLKDLEGQFDIKLFDRVGKRLQLNATGAAFRPRAQALVDQALELEQDFARHADLGRIRVGATLTIGNYIAIELLDQFRRQNPHAKVELEIGNTVDIAEKVLNFDLDIGLIEGEYWHPDLAVVHWYEDDLTLFCSPRHPYASCKQLTDQDLIEAQWILREPGSGTRQAFDRAMGGILPDLTIGYELQHTEAIKQAVKQNLGISCLSEMALREEFANGSLVAIGLDHRNLHRTMYRITHKQKYLSEGVSRWLELCERYVN